MEEDVAARFSNFKEEWATIVATFTLVACGTRQGVERVLVEGVLVGGRLCSESTGPAPVLMFSPREVNWSGGKLFSPLFEQSFGS